MSKITPVLWEILAEYLEEEPKNWLNEKESAPIKEVMTAFVAAPRHLPKKLVNPSEQQSAQLSNLFEGFSVNNWTVVRLARVWLLSLFDDTDQQNYVHTIQTLFETAEMNELVALYSALPVLSYPERWLATATDAVRSNIGVVLDAIALQNPYPAKHFPEGAWNQLIMKSIFNDKPVELIYGLEERRNAELTRILIDFAHERWAAGRHVPPGVWRLVIPFINEELLSDLKKLFKSAREEDRQAAALVCYFSEFEPATELLENYPLLKEEIEKGNLSWKNFEIGNLSSYVS